MLPLPTEGGYHRGGNEHFVRADVSHVPFKTANYLKKNEFMHQDMSQSTQSAVENCRYRT